VKVAVVGAGFAGLALCYYLLEKGVSVDLIDCEGVGAGASGAAVGLLHPYAGEQVRRSYQATEALEEAKKLLSFASVNASVADFSGILRRADSEQSKMLLQHQKQYGDVEKLEDGLFWIKSGITVHSRRYLDGLFSSLQAKGLQWKLQKIKHIDNLLEYDLFFLAIGAGVFSLPGLEVFSLQGIKGQAITCKWPDYLTPLSMSLMGKGYVVPMEGGLVQVGSTYERGLKDNRVDMEKALAELTPKMRLLLPLWDPIEAISCRAGVRVSRREHYFPLLTQVGSQGWMITALGSRGLLYHAYGAKKLVEMAFGK
jgi:glycine/D-amino acid oxidase-like deaminating enzyme